METRITPISGGLFNVYLRSWKLWKYQTNFPPSFAMHVLYWSLWIVVKTSSRAPCYLGWVVAYVSLLIVCTPFPSFPTLITISHTQFHRISRISLACFVRYLFHLMNTRDLIKSAYFKLGFGWLWLYNFLLRLYSYLDVGIICICLLLGVKCVLNQTITTS